MGNLIIHSDGGSRGNPGPAAIGVVAQLDGKTVFEISKTIGVTTNNVAEYTAVLEGVKKIISLPSSDKTFTHIEWMLDSQLVVEQIMGRYAVKKDHIRDLLSQIAVLRLSLPYTFSFIHVPREQNKEADRLVNLALDSQKN